MPKPKKQTQALEALDAVKRATTASRFTVIVAFPQKGDDLCIEIHPWKGTDVVAQRVIEKLQSHFGLSPP